MKKKEHKRRQSWLTSKKEIEGGEREREREESQVKSKRRELLARRRLSIY